MLKPGSVAAGLGAGVAISSILGSVIYARASERCGSPGILLVSFGVIGTSAFLAVLWRERTHSAPARYSVWTLLGAICATATVGVMSVFPWALLAGGLLFLSSLLDLQRDRKGLVASVGFLVAGAFLTFIGLYQTTIRWGIDEVEVPAESLVTEFLAPIDYSDAFRVQVPVHAPLSRVGRAEVLLRSLRPCWVEPPPGGILTSEGQGPDSTLGDWPIYGSNENELVVGLNRSFIDLRLSFLEGQFEAGPSVIVSTVARYNDLGGRLYFLPVRLAHRIVLADAMRRIRAHLGQ